MNKKNIYPWIVWSLGAFLFFSEYMGRVAPGVMVPNLIMDFGINALAIGALSAAFYYIYVTMQVPVGMMMDRFRPAKLLAITAIICALGCYLFARSETFYFAILGRFLMGLGASFAFVGTLKLGTIWFPAERFGLIAGLTQSSGMLGAAVGETSIAYAITYTSWRNTMVILATLFVVLGLLIFFIIKDKPDNTQDAEVKKSTHKRSPYSFWHTLKIVLKNPQSWLNACFVGFLYSPTAAFPELWGATYLNNVYGINPHAAAIGITMIFLGWGVGGPIIGMISDYFQRRKPIMIISAALSLLTMGWVLYGHFSSIGVLYAVLFMYGIANTGVITSYALSSEINPRAVSGTSMAFANMASVIFGAAFQPIIGWLLDKHSAGHGKIITGATPVNDHIKLIYTVADFHYAVFVIPVCIFLSFILGFFIKETYCRPIP